MTTPPLTPAEQDELDTLLAGQHPTVRARLATAWYLARARRQRDEEQCSCGHHTADHDGVLGYCITQHCTCVPEHFGRPT